MGSKSDKAELSQTCGKVQEQARAREPTEEKGGSMSQVASEEMVA
jgi:hypothetical protein